MGETDLGSFPMMDFGFWAIKTLAYTTTEI
jgi:hypothetical protein